MRSCISRVSASISLFDLNPKAALTLGQNSRRAQTPTRTRTSNWRFALLIEMVVGSGMPSAGTAKGRLIWMVSSVTFAILCLAGDDYRELELGVFERLA